MVEGKAGGAVDGELPIVGATAEGEIGMPAVGQRQRAGAGVAGGSGEADAVGAEGVADAEAVGEGIAGLVAGVIVAQFQPCLFIVAAAGGDLERGIIEQAVRGVAGGVEFASAVGLAVESVFAVADAAGKRAEFGAVKACGKVADGCGRGGIAANGVEPTAVGQTDGIGVEQRAVGVDFGVMLRMLQYHTTGVDLDGVHGGWGE